MWVDPARPAVEYSRSFQRSFATLKQQSLGFMHCFCKASSVPAACCDTLCNVLYRMLTPQMLHYYLQPLSASRKQLPPKQQASPTAPARRGLTGARLKVLQVCVAPVSHARSLCLWMQMAGADQASFPNLHAFRLHVAHIIVNVFCMKHVCGSALTAMLQRVIKCAASPNVWLQM